MALETKQSWEVRLAEMVSTGNTSAVARQYSLTVDKALGRIQALHLAVRYNQLPMLMHLLQLGEVNPRSTMANANAWQWELVALAAQWGRVRILALLIDYFRDPPGGALLFCARHAASVFGQTEVLGWLDSRNAHPDNALTYLALAAARGQWAAVSYGIRALGKLRASPMMFLMPEFVDRPPVGRDCPLSVMRQLNNVLSMEQLRWLHAVDCVLSTYLCPDLIGVVESYLSYTSPPKNK